jgi:hypothetical protein
VASFFPFHITYYIRAQKGLDHMAAVREKFLAITDRFAGYQAQWFNVHL